MDGQTRFFSLKREGFNFYYLKICQNSKQVYLVKEIQCRCLQIPSSIWQWTIGLKSQTIQDKDAQDTSNKQQATSMLGGGVRCHGGRAHKMHQSFRCDIDKPPTKDKNAKQGFDKYS